MRYARVVAGVIVTCALVCRGSSSSAGSPQTRDVELVARTGSASISGVAVTSNGVRLVGATVTLSTDIGVAPNQAVTTDANGAFLLSSIAPGTYELSAQMPDFVPAYYGQTKPGRPGVPLTVGDRQIIRDITLTLVRGGVIAGTITDPSGQPGWGSVVRLLKRAYSNQGPSFTEVAGALALVDDLGQYRLHGLMPGEYLVMADPRRGSDTRPTERLIATCYPGSATVDQATAVTLGPGEQKVGIDIRELSSVVTTIVGHAVNARYVWITPAESALAAPVSVRLVGDAGRFEILDLVPGRYRIGASDQTPVPKGGEISADRRWAMTEVTLGPAGIGDLTLALTRGAIVSGRIVLERAPGVAGPAKDISLSAVHLMPISGVVLPAGDDLVAKPDAEGRFTFAAVPPGRYSVFSAVPAGWRAKSAVFDRRDVFDTQLDVSSDVRDLVITLTDSPTEISGRLFNAPRSRGAYTVIAFAADAQYWIPGTRRIRTAGLRDSGFVLSSLPPGKYLLAVLEDAEPGTWYDPRVLEALRSSAVPVTVADGQRVVQDLRVR